ncbi:MAG TPA: WxL domain-containing protein [Thermomicrobiales bacterium]|nr:WxL domain-containing protein [Thermomicrobiales bacterium]
MNFKSKVFSVAAASIFALSLGTSAMASTASVSQEITGNEEDGNTLTATLTNINFDALPYSHSVQYSEGEFTLTVNDLRGTYEGWAVSVSSGTFEYQGEVVGDWDISADNFALIGILDPVYVAGQSIDGGLVSTSNTGTLDQSRNVLNAESGSGAGKYTQDLGVKLTVPADRPVGDYIATVTVSLDAAPGQGGEN